MVSENQCQFKAGDGSRCPNAADESGNCFWHNTKLEKNQIGIKDRLQDYVKTGGYLKGLQLRGANLEGINLVNQNEKNGYDFSESDFYHANLRASHLFNIKLENGSLMKADLREANLHLAHLKATNLLGIRLEGSKIDHIEIGPKILQEELSKATKDQQEALSYHHQAEEVYRCLRKAADEQGLFSLGGYFIHRELTMRRYCHPKYSAERAWSKAIDLFCGYGERPGNVVLFSMMLILVCACFYFTLGIRFEGEVLQLDVSGLTLVENLKGFLISLYFSTVTFTTLGYGDVTPIGYSRPIAAVEAFSGGFTLALFVVVFVKKMTR